MSEAGNCQRIVALLRTLDVALGIPVSSRVRNYAHASNGFREAWPLTRA